MKLEEQAGRGEYVPAIRSEKCLALYDPIVRWTLRESAFKGLLVRQAGIRPGERVLDVGCGTATLAILLKRAYPDAEIIGLDGDPKILQIARDKVAREGLRIALGLGMAFALPFANNQFDRVVSSLLLHHLTREQKALSLEEAFRVLRSGGRMHIADFDRPQNVLMRAASRLLQLADGRETTQDNLDGAVPGLSRQAGFQGVAKTAQFMTLAGTLALYRMAKA